MLQSCLLPEHRGEQSFFGTFDGAASARDLSISLFDFPCFLSLLGAPLRRSPEAGGVDFVAQGTEGRAMTTNQINNGIDDIIRQGLVMMTVKSWWEIVEQILKILRE